MGRAANPTPHSQRPALQPRRGRGVPALARPLRPEVEMPPGLPRPHQRSACRAAASCVSPAPDVDTPHREGGWEEGGWLRAQR